MMSMRMAVKAARRGGDEAVDGLLTILGGGDERAALFEHIGRDLTVEGIVLGHEDTDAVAYELADILQRMQGIAHLSHDIVHAVCQIFQCI